MNEYDLTGKFGWYLALGSLVLLTVIGKWFELKEPITCESEPSLFSEPLLDASMSQVKNELTVIRGEISLIAGDLARQQVTLDGMSAIVDRIDHRLETVQSR